MRVESNFIRYIVEGDGRSCVFAIFISKECRTRILTKVHGCEMFAALARRLSSRWLATTAAGRNGARASVRAAGSASPPGISHVRLRFSCRTSVLLCLYRPSPRTTLKVQFFFFTSKNMNLRVRENRTSGMNKMYSGGGANCVLQWPLRRRTREEKLGRLSDRQMSRFFFFRHSSADYRNSSPN